MPDDRPDEVIHVADSVNEFVERTRLEEIHAAKQDAADALRNSERFVAEYRGRAGREEARLMARKDVRSAVEGYILELETLYRRTDPGRTLWAEAPLGTYPLRELAPALDLGGDDVTDVLELGLRRSDLPLRVRHGRDRAGDPTGITAATVTVSGVGQFVDGLSGQAVAEVGTEMSTSPNPAATSTEERAAELVAPVELSREAFRATNALLSESDVGMRLVDADGGDVENDYSELLDEYDS